jgi:hypothetical protein
MDGSAGDIWNIYQAAMQVAGAPVNANDNVLGAEWWVSVGLPRVNMLQCVAAAWKGAALGLDVHPIATFATIKLNRQDSSKFHFLGGWM